MRKFSSVGKTRTGWFTFHFHGGYKLEALFAGFRNTGYLGKKLMGVIIFRGKIDGIRDVLNRYAGLSGRKSVVLKF